MGPHRAALPLRRRPEIARRHASPENLGARRLRQRSKPISSCRRCRCSFAANRLFNIENIRKQTINHYIGQAMTTSELGSMRKELDERTVDPDPVKQFQEW